MALSDLAVYSEYTYSAMTEVLRQQVELFNAATGGAIALSSAAHQGDFSDTAFFQKISGLVRRRNAYGSGSVGTKQLAHLVDTMVKVASGTDEIRLDPGQFRWIQQNPEVAGAALGQQLAAETLADMLNIAIGATYAALVQESAVVYDATGQSSKVATFVNLNKAQAKFGDRANQIVAWVMHSTSLFDLYASALTNSERLFTYETVNVIRDPFGKLLVATDSPNLINTAPNPDTYHILGLVPGAVRVDQNNDFDAAEETRTGNENIIRTYQAEWSYNLGVKGFSWDKGTGGASPNDGALLSSANWNRYATSEKDLAGVVLETQAA